MKILKLYEEWVDYRREINKIRRPDSSICADDYFQGRKKIRNNVLNEIKEEIKSHGLDKVIFIYGGDYGDEEYFYTEKIDFDEIYIETAQRYVTTLILTPDGNLKIHAGTKYQVVLDLDEAGDFEIIQVYEYLKKMTPLMWKEQKIKQESEKFNI